MQLQSIHSVGSLVAVGVIVAAACGPSTPGAPGPATSPTPIPTTAAAGAPTPTSSTVVAMATGAAPAGAAVNATPTGTRNPVIDELFIDMMVPHHEGALAMARIAQQRAEHPELRQLAEDILRSQ